jgi:hypothetical protein
VSYLPPLRDPIRTIGRRRFDFDHQIVVMVIVNRTPDSFFDGGETYALDEAVAAALLPLRRVRTGSTLAAFLFHLTRQR